jgi:uncharacterized membrane protein
MGDGLFDTVMGLPVHPLVVHVAVVLLPLSALGLIALVLVPRWRGSFGWLVLAGLAIGTAGAFVAKESGEALSRRVGLPQEHAEWGDRLPLLAAALFLVAVTWFWLDRRSHRETDSATSGSSRIPTRILGALAIILAVAATALTVVVGHSGATAVWEGRIQATSTEAAPTPAPSGAATSAAGGLTMAEVANHSTAGDCWSVVQGNVYDLTSWIQQHPGGPDVIKAMCGVDATTSFLSQHDGQRDPAKELKSRLVGPLSAA